MTYICYVEKSFRGSTLEIIDIAREICDEYQAQGFSLILRQLYYQFVARNHISNTERSYKRIGNIINDARMAGLIDWDVIEDRTRTVRSHPHWSTVAEIVESCSEQFRFDLWEGQPYRPEVWIEKDALIGVVERVCQRYDVPYFACRGYNSQSEQWRAGRRFLRHRQNGQDPIVLHLGDHDPSGLDMTTDNTTRLARFAEGDVEVRRLALNIDQVRQYRPPPNPAKTTDSRAAEYIAQFGYDSWELDALEPHVIESLVETALKTLIVPDTFETAQQLQQKARGRLKALAQELS